MVIFRGYQNLLDKNVFPQKNSKLTKIQWSPSYDNYSAFYWLVFAVTQKQLRQKSFFHHPNFFLKKVTFHVIDLYLVVLGHTKYKVTDISTKYKVIYQVQSTFYQVTCTWYLGASTKYKVLGQKYLVHCQLQK